MSKRKPQGVMGVGGDVLENSDSVTLTVLITDAAGQVLFDGETSVTPTKLQPNGPGCDPTVWVGHVRLSGTSELRSFDPDDSA